MGGDRFSGLEDGVEWVGEWGGGVGVAGPHGGAGTPLVKSLPCPLPASHSHRPAPLPPARRRRRAPYPPHPTPPSPPQAVVSPGGVGVRDRARARARRGEEAPRSGRGAFLFSEPFLAGLGEGGAARRGGPPCATTTQHANLRHDTPTRHPPHPPCAQFDINCGVRLIRTNLTGGALLAALVRWLLDGSFCFFLLGTFLSCGHRRTPPHAQQHAG